MSGILISTTASANNFVKVSVTQPATQDLSASITQGIQHSASGVMTSKHSDLELYGPWLTAEGYSSNAQELINYIQDSRVQGLNPEAYDLTPIINTVKAIAKLNSRIESGATDSSQLIASKRADVENQLSVAFVKLANDLGKGATKAKDVQRRMFRAVPKVDAQSWLDAISTGQVTTAQALDSLMPQNPAYHRLSNRMRQLLAERSSGKHRIVIEESEVHASEFAAHDIQRIKLKLMETGELPMNTEMTSDWNSNAEYALQSFQQRSGLPVTGTLDAETRKALNHTLDEEIQEVAMSLERWRWMPRELGKTHVMVNIPEFRVALKKDDRTLLSMTTVVGSVEHATPTFSEDMKHIVFNPTWTVPKSITNRELIPLERKNPGYLKSKGFDIMRRDGDYLVKVSYSDITQSDLTAKRFPYVLQQRSGKRNALGRMKFMMPNQWSIYMHDTQAKDLFSHHVRAYSHGCIRLSDPEAMARALLTEDGYTDMEIEAHLARSKQKLVKLRTPVPTHLSYFTSWVDEYGTFNRRNDIYDYNDALIRALKSNNTLLSVLDTMPIASAAKPRTSNGS